jgi:hypothetical protein
LIRTEHRWRVFVASGASVAVAACYHPAASSRLRPLREPLSKLRCAGCARLQGLAVVCQSRCVAFLDASVYSILFGSVIASPLLVGSLLTRLMDRFAAEGLVVGSVTATMAVAMVFGAATDGSVRAPSLSWRSVSRPSVSLRGAQHARLPLHVDTSLRPRSFHSLPPPPPLFAPASYAPSSGWSESHRGLFLSCAEVDTETLCHRCPPPLRRRRW